MPGSNQPAFRRQFEPVEARLPPILPSAPVSFPTCTLALIRALPAVVMATETALHNLFWPHVFFNSPGRFNPAAKDRWQHHSTPPQLVASLSVMATKANCVIINLPRRKVRWLVCVCRRDEESHCSRCKNSCCGPKDVFGHALCCQPRGGGGVGDDGDTRCSRPVR